jgi:ubiquinone/menaquinone biosynthesis C-methylase UbiE
MRESWFRYDHYFSDCTFPEALKAVFDPPPRTLLDVGGNTGKWAMQCLAHDPQVQVTIMDLPRQVRMMAEAVAGLPGADRITALGVDFLAPDVTLPDGFDVIWMSQFLDCFREADIIRILRLAAAAMTAQTRLYINEIYWDRQRFETAAFVLMQSSPYFTAMANGHSKFLAWPDMQRCIQAAGLRVEHNSDGLGWGHTLTLCRLAACRG